MSTIPPQSPVPGPQNFKIAQAFGFLFDGDAAQATMQATIDTAQQVAGALQSKVTQNLTQQVAESAIGSASLQLKAMDNMQAQVNSSQAALQQLQQPIMSSIVNQLGATIEATIPLGVDPTATGLEATCPTCVQLRQSSQNGDISQAMTCFVSAVLPLRDSRGVDYANGVSWLKKCIAQDAATQANFDHAMTALLSDARARQTVTQQTTQQVTQQQQVTQGYTGCKDGVYYVNGIPSPSAQNQALCNPLTGQTTQATQQAASGGGFTGCRDGVYYVNGLPSPSAQNNALCGPPGGGPVTFQSQITWQQFYAAWKAGNLASVTIA